MPSTEPETRLPNERTPAVFLDRDGTIMEDVDYCGRAEDVHVYEGASAAIRCMKEVGYKIIVITNQSGIGRGYFSEESYRAVEAEMERQLGAELIDASYFCPDHPDAASTRRKPDPGMVHEAASDHHLDLARSYFIGDKRIDAECGRNAGVRTILVNTGKKERDTNSMADWLARDLSEAAEIILRNGI